MCGSGDGAGWRSLLVSIEWTEQHEVSTVPRGDDRGDHDVACHARRLALAIDTHAVVGEDDGPHPHPWVGAADPCDLDHARIVRPRRAAMVTGW